MFWKPTKRKIREVIGLFNGHFIEVKALYALLFDEISCVAFIGDLEAGKAYEYILETMGAEIVTTYQHSYFDHAEQKMFFNNTIFVLKNRRIIELGNNWCQVLHTPHQYNWSNAVISELSKYKIVSNGPAIGFARQASAN